MSKNIRYTLLSLRDLAVSIGPFALLTLALLALTYWWLDPNPPKRVVLATGPAQSAYDEFGKRYATALARYGITVELLPSEGSSANLELLRAGKADIGFVQGGSADIGYDDEESIVSLGSLFVEPLWLFYREDAAQRLKKSPTIANLSELQGGRVNVGTPGSGVPRLPSTTSLLAGAKTHPAILQLFAQTATDLHGGGGWFSRAREYPSLEHSEVPLSPEAVRAIRNGPPFLQRYLPFWLANLVERMWLAMGLILALALPLSRIVPPLYAFRIRSRVFRWYGQLRTIEQRSQDNDGPLPLPELLEQLDALENKVEQVVVPLSYTDELYALRNNIALVRQKLLQRTSSNPLSPCRS